MTIMVNAGEPLTVKTFMSPWSLPCLWSALPVDAVGVKATIIRPPGISLISGQNDTFYVGDILVGESRNVSWLVKAIETGIHNICVNVTDLYSHEWEGCAEVKSVDPPTVNIKYCVPPSVQADASFTLDAEVSNPTELTAKSGIYSSW